MKLDGYLLGTQKKRSRVRQVQGRRQKNFRGGGGNEKSQKIAKRPKNSTKPWGNRKKDRKWQKKTEK